MNRLLLLPFQFTLQQDICYNKIPHRYHSVANLLGTFNYNAAININKGRIKPLSLMQYNSAAVQNYSLQDHKVESTPP